MQTRSTSTIRRLFVAAAVLLGFTAAALALPSAAEKVVKHALLPRPGPLFRHRKGG